MKKTKYLVVVMVSILCLGTGCFFAFETMEAALASIDVQEYEQE